MSAVSQTVYDYGQAEPESTAGDRVCGWDTWITVHQMLRHSCLYHTWELYISEKNMKSPP